MKIELPLGELPQEINCFVEVYKKFRTLYRWDSVVSLCCNKVVFKFDIKKVLNYSGKKNLGAKQI